MQHYGVPTRLLDWTENSLTALHFALMTARKEPIGKALRYAGPAAIWVLNPTLWNSKALEHLSYTGGPLVPGDEALKGYLANTPHVTLNKHPVAMFGAHNSARIVAQQGVFTIFGEGRTPMEALIRAGAIPPAALPIITIQTNKIDAMRNALLNHGVTESTIYPDLEGLAREIKRHFGFEVQS